MDQRRRSHVEHATPKSKFQKAMTLVFVVKVWCTPVWPPTCTLNTKYETILSHLIIIWIIIIIIRGLHSTILFYFLRTSASLTASQPTMAWKIGMAHWLIPFVFRIAIHELSITESPGGLGWWRSSQQSLRRRNTALLCRRHDEVSCKNGVCVGGVNQIYSGPKCQGFFFVFQLWTTVGRVFGHWTLAYRLQITDKFPFLCLSSIKKAMQC